MSLVGLLAAVDDGLVRLEREKTEKLRTPLVEVIEFQ